MKRKGAFIAVATLGLGGYSTAHGYSATADVTFTWAGGGTTIAWTSDGVNVFPDPTIAGNDTEVFGAGGNNSTSYYNSAFAISSDYDAGTADDCLTPLPNYRWIVIRKYSCRHERPGADPYGYFSPRYRATPVSDAGPGASATGRLTATDTTLTGTLTVIKTTDEPKGATTRMVLGVRTSNSPGNGLNGYNVRTSGGSPFGTAWYGITTRAELAVDLTGRFDATNWIIDGGTVTISDAGFACQDGGVTEYFLGPLCTPSGTGGGFQADGKMLSWGMDTDGASTGTAAAAPISLRDATGTTTIATISGVLAHLTLDVRGAIATEYGEFRSGTGSAAGGCVDHVRWGDDTDPGPGTSIGISCGTLSAGPLVITGNVTEGGGSSLVDPLLLALLGLSALLRRLLLPQDQSNLSRSQAMSILVIPGGTRTDLNRS